MVSKVRMLRKQRQAKAIPSPMVWDVNSNKWMKNPVLEVKKDASAPSSSK